MTTTTTARYVSPSEAAGYLGVTTKTIRNYIARGELNGYRLGARAIRVDKRELEQLLRPIPTVRGGAR